MGDIDNSQRLFCGLLGIFRIFSALEVKELYHVSHMIVDRSNTVFSKSFNVSGQKINRSLHGISKKQIIGGNCHQLSNRFSKTASFTFLLQEHVILDFRKPAP